MASLAAMLEWKYGPIASTAQKDPDDTGTNPEMVITVWRHKTIAQPTKAKITTDMVEYETYLAAEVTKKETLAIETLALKDKYTGQVKDNITDADALEWVKLQMAGTIGL